MLTLQDHSETLILLWFYIIVYNLSLILALISISQLTLSELKTIHIFTYTGLDTTVSRSITIALLSMAGVPPFLGFFSKMFIFIMISNSNLLVFSAIFFLILLISLYFYMQNIRFLNTSKNTSRSISFNGSVRILPNYLRISTVIVTFLVIGFLIVDDFMLIILPWILVL